MNSKNIIFINRVALFIVYAWFGFLKIIGHSPAEELVQSLARITLEPYISSDFFVYLLGYFECTLGILWLFPKFTKLAFWILAFHLGTTFLPMIFMADQIWQELLTPSLVGQYIIKNIVLLASAMTIYASVKEENVSYVFKTA